MPDDGSTTGTTARTSLGPRMPAARNTVAVLRALASSTHPLPAADLAHRTGLPRSSTYQLLQVLVDEGLVVHLPELHAYALGVGVFELGSAYLRREPLEQLARPLLADLARRTAQTAHLGILQGSETLYLVKEQPRKAAALVTEVGVRLPAHLTASGRAVLALLPENQVSAIFAAPGSFVDRTGLGPRTGDELDQLLRGDRKRGWAVEEGGVTPGVTCIAAAAVEHSGRPVASVALSFLTSSHPRRELDTLARPVVATARALSRRLGGRPVRR